MPVDTPASASRRVRAIVAAGVVGVLACGGFVIASLYVDLPDWSTRVAATLLAALYATALSVRLGGRPLLPAVLVIAYGAVATATGWQTLLGGAAVGMAVLAASLAIMATVPAPTVRRAVVETVIAAVVATFGGLGCRGFAAGLHQDRFASIVLGLTLLAAFVIVYRLGAGFHGLGRRGYVVAITAAVVLVLAPVVLVLAPVVLVLAALVVDVLASEAKVLETVGVVLSVPVVVVLGTVVVLLEPANVVLGVPGVVVLEPVFVMLSEPVVVLGPAVVSLSDPVVLLLLAHARPPRVTKPMSPTTPVPPKPNVCA